MGSAGHGRILLGCKKETLNLEQLISDAAELVEYLCAALEKEKLFVWGGSWGTELGTYLCFRYPEHIAGYVGSGQLVNGVLNEELSYDFAMDEAKKPGTQRPSPRWSVSDARWMDATARCLKA